VRNAAASHSAGRERRLTAAQFDGLEDAEQIDDAPVQLVSSTLLTRWLLIRQPLEAVLEARRLDLAQRHARLQRPRPLLKPRDAIEKRPPLTN
jgi:hypothetical protein